MEKSSSNCENKARLLHRYGRIHKQPILQATYGHIAISELALR